MSVKCGANDRRLKSNSKRVSGGLVVVVSTMRGLQRTIAYNVVNIASG